MFKDIKDHLDAIGVAPLGEGAPAVAPSFWAGIEERTGGRVPSEVKDIYAVLGGFRFPEGAFYFDPKYQCDIQIGWFMDEAEVAEAFEDTRDNVPDDLLPLANDGGDNFLAVGIGEHNNGVVVFIVHDAPTPERIYTVDDSVAHFLRSLHGED